MQVKFTRYRYGKNKTAIRNIVVDDKKIGYVKRTPATREKLAHWTGEILVNGEIWRIGELTLDEVVNRIAEAYRNVNP